MHKEMDQVCNVWRKVCTSMSCRHFSLTVNLKLLSQLPCPALPAICTHTHTHSALPMELCSTTVHPIFSPETDKLSVTLPSYSSGSLIDHKVLLILVLNISQISPLLSITSATTQFGHYSFVPGLWEQAPNCSP